MKKKYETPEIELAVVEAGDIMLASGNDTDIDSSFLFPEE